MIEQIVVSMRGQSSSAILLLALSLALFQPTSHAAVFAWAGGALVVKGKIELGDYDKTISILKSMNTVAPMVYLSSLGGNVREAIKIGRMLRKLDIPVSVFEDISCASSCVLILLGSTQRLVMPGARIGLHRTYIEREQFAKLTATDASRSYQLLKEEVSLYLQDMGAPKSFIDKMYTISSDEVLWLSANEFYELIPIKPEFIVELSLARCGPPLDEIEEDILWGRLKVNDESIRERVLDRHFAHLNCEMNLAANERRSFMELHGIDPRKAVKHGAFDLDIVLKDGAFDVKRGRSYKPGDQSIMGLD